MASYCGRCDSADVTTSLTMSTHTLNHHPMVMDNWYYIMPLCAPCARHVQAGFEQTIQPALGIKRVQKELKEQVSGKPATVTPLKIVKSEKDKPPKDPA